MVSYKTYNSQNSSFCCQRCNLSYHANLQLLIINPVCNFRAKILQNKIRLIKIIFKFNIQGVPRNMTVGEWF